MNKFVAIVKKLLNVHGVDCVYKSIATGSYDVDTGSVTTSETIINTKTYPKIIKSSQFYYPHLIGKEAIVFYFDPTVVTPKLEDIIYFDSKSYKVEEVTQHIANGQIALYKVVGVK